MKTEERKRECLETFPSISSMILNFCFFSSKIIIALCNVPLVRSFTFKYFSIKEKRICTQINSITTDDYISEIISWHHLNDNGGRRPYGPAYECMSNLIPLDNHTFLRKAIPNILRQAFLQCRPNSLIDNHTRSLAWPNLKLSENV